MCTRACTQSLGALIIEKRGLQVLGRTGEELQNSRFSEGVESERNKALELEHRKAKNQEVELEHNRFYEEE